VATVSAATFFEQTESAAGAGQAAAFTYRIAFGPAPGRRY